ncbi:Putative translation factor (SUA5) [Chromobacterium violaceum]|uniref:Translation factor (SUA5) n=1 Tax=Chromobacterium violaceum TaxID=536 RepID=A0A447TAQ5_CHRVL|nr:Putative translation factor (SUA5) [Chromobacterium violaceum]
MAQFFVIHPENPQARLIREAVKILREGGVIAYPTDSCYALGCALGDKEAMERILEIRGVDLKQRLMTLVCHDLSELANYAKVDNRQYRLLKSTTPAATPSSCRRRARCRAARSTPSGPPSACACRTTRWRWPCWRSWANPSCPVP